MKKWLVIVVSVVILLFFASYLIFPSPEFVKGKTFFKASSDGAYRMLSQQYLWDSFTNGKTSINKRLFNSFEISVNINNNKMPTQLLLIPLSKDSVEVAWQAPLPSTNSILAKWNKYRIGIKIKNNISNALVNFRKHVEVISNVYGFDIYETSTTDTLLLAKRFNSASYPSTAEIYSYIAQLEEKALQLNAASTGFPMLNVSREDSAAYRCMVAIPINRAVDAKGEIFFVRMVPGKFLVIDVTGGPRTIQSAHQAMQLYYKDFKRVTMAIPFEYLITNRLNEPDTTNWSTKIYGPVY